MLYVSWSKKDPVVSCDGNGPNENEINYIIITVSCGKNLLKTKKCEVNKKISGNAI